MSGHGRMSEQDAALIILRMRVDAGKARGWGRLELERLERARAAAVAHGCTLEAVASVMGTTARPAQLEAGAGGCTCGWAPAQYCEVLEHRTAGAALELEAGEGGPVLEAACMATLFELEEGGR